MTTKRKEKKRKKLHSHLSNQESILQSTRNMHYVFQALFLGIAFALLAISYSVFSSREADQYLFFEFSYTSLMISLLFSCFAIIIFGNIFLDDYSTNIFKRGVVIDVLQHLRTLRYYDKLEKFEGICFEKVKPDYLFLLIKNIERITSDFGRKHRVSKTFYRTEERYSSNCPRLLPYKNFDILLYICFFNDINDTEYLPSKYDSKHTPSENFQTTKARDISQPRKGHLHIFRLIWALYFCLWWVVLANVLS